MWMGCGSNSLANAMISALLTVRPPQSITFPASKSSKYLGKLDIGGNPTPGGRRLGAHSSTWQTDSQILQPRRPSSGAQHRVCLNWSKTEHLSSFRCCSGLGSQFADHSNHTLNQHLVCCQLPAANVPIVLKPHSDMAAKNDGVRGGVNLSAADTTDAEYRILRQMIHHRLENFWSIRIAPLKPLRVQHDIYEIRRLVVSRIDQTRGIL